MKKCFAGILIAACCAVAGFAQENREPKTLNASTNTNLQSDMVVKVDVYYNLKRAYQRPASLRLRAICSGRLDTQNFVSTTQPALLGDHDYVLYLTYRGTTPVSLSEISVELMVEAVTLPVEARTITFAHDFAPKPDIIRKWNVNAISPNEVNVSVTCDTSSIASGTLSISAALLASMPANALQQATTLAGAPTAKETLKIGLVEAKRGIRLVYAGDADVTAAGVRLMVWTTMTVSSPSRTSPRRSPSGGRAMSRRPKAIARCGRPISMRSPRAR